MSKTVAVVMASLFIGLALGCMITFSASRPTQQASNPYLLPPSRAQSNPSNYGPDLDYHTLIAEKGVVTGRVVRIGMNVENEQERYHFLVLPDPSCSNMLNDGNRAKLGGALMVELIYNDNFVAPKLHIGMHLEIQGPHVTDNNNGWNEIDPANVIKEL